MGKHTPRKPPRTERKPGAILQNSRAPHKPMPKVLPTKTVIMILGKMGFRRVDSAHGQEFAHPSLGNINLGGYHREIGLRGNDRRLKRIVMAYLSSGGQI